MAELIFKTREEWQAENSRRFEKGILISASFLGAFLALLSLLMLLKAFGYLSVETVESVSIVSLVVSGVITLIWLRRPHIRPISVTSEMKAGWARTKTSTTEVLTRPLIPISSPYVPDWDEIRRVAAIEEERETKAQQEASASFVATLEKLQASLSADASLGVSDFVVVYYPGLDQKQSLKILNSFPHILKFFYQCVLLDTFSGDTDWEEPGFVFLGRRQ